MSRYLIQCYFNGTYSCSFPQFPDISDAGAQLRGYVRDSDHMVTGAGKVLGRHLYHAYRKDGLEIPYPKGLPALIDEGLLDLDKPYCYKWVHPDYPLLNG